jgi:hypothetical protein
MSLLCAVEVKDCQYIGELGTAAVYVLFSVVSMQDFGQKALGRNHLHTSVYLNKHFYCMIIFN